MKLKDQTLEETLLKYNASNATMLIATIFAMKSIFILSYVYRYWDGDFSPDLQ
eukprot:CAMPEP_0204910908 /NCGR_PEP_ID=MMETSP1397-20131031/9353_1 /ASSEMBLY_ACC=CAM_ASM_000891 /TAXON_ID=49980 /ORGANISM="Climacostomum Climacostomum virens, Strain Stock W-24" /LENGTH=52 /DNA_ID=CAMNT_0052081255 /DNA_START=252 /DNA_END=407 /DNA_ORIENTATION=-